MNRWDEALGRVRFQRRHAALVVAVALLADYFSPAATWTAALPLMFMAVLLAFRQRNAALAVLLLSSWILVPAAAGVACAYHAVRGTPTTYAVRHDGVTTGQVCSLRHSGSVEVRLMVTERFVQPATWTSTSAMKTITIDVEGDGPVASMEADVAASFAFLHNWMTTFSGEVECRPRTAADDLPGSLEHPEWPFQLR